MKYRYHTRRSSVVLSVSNLFEDMLDKEVNFKHMFECVAGAASFKDYQMRIAEVWATHCAKDFFEMFSSIDDVLVQYYGDESKSCLASRDDFKDVEEVLEEKIVGV